jgi:hypothetical protein
VFEVGNGTAINRRHQARCAGARLCNRAAHHELTDENGAPTLGSQNQAVEFIRADPELRLAVIAWAKTVDIDEATIAPQRRLPFDGLHNQVRAFLQRIMVPRVFH